MKSNEGLAQFAEESLGVPYIFGTYGQVLTERTLAEKAKQYPSKLSEKRVKYARAHYIGKRTTDCYGLIKHYLWTGGDAEHPLQTETPVYNSKQDVTANDAYSRAKVKGPIETIPDVRGICVRYNGHAGVYVGKDKAGTAWVIEARGFDYGTVKTKLKDRNWTHWYQDINITYKNPAEPEKKPEVEEMKLVELKKGDKGTDAVLSWQALCNAHGYTDDNGKMLELDRSFGAKTQQATIKAQKANKLPQTGVVTEDTWKAVIE